MLDPARYEGIAHRPLDFAAPVDPDVVRDWLPALGAPATVLDLGCGTGAWVCAVVRGPGQRGWGVDRAPAVLAAAAARGNAAIEWVQADAAAWLREACVRADLVICVGAEHLAGAWRDTIALAAGAVADGGQLLLGTSVRRPHPVWDALPAVAAQIPTPDELDAALARWTTLRQHTFGRDAYARYDRACRAAVDAHLAATPDDPDRAEIHLRNEKGRLFFEGAGLDALAFELRLLGQRSVSA